MIINSEQSNIEVVGDVKEFKTSIDPRNLEFITTLLSSNLYSDPEQSFIREIVSNAWDSHVEAGTTDIPILIKFGVFDELHYITIRDYGTGLSPERFQEVYCNIGSSTKRESNDYIGGFGIGKYSSLACSNTVYITSYYEGIAYYYVMVKSGNSITTTLLMEKATAEKNGVEVTIKNISNISNYESALNCITFFPNIYIDGLIYNKELNSIKVKKFKNFAAASCVKSRKLLLGNVLYPLDKGYFSPSIQGFLSRITNTGIVIRFDVGEINVTPNRENIIYNNSTVEKIQRRIELAKEELDNLVNTRIPKDYNNIMEWFEEIVKPKLYDPITNSIVNYGCYYPVDLSTSINLPITYNGTKLQNYISYIKHVLTLGLPNFKCIVDKDKVYIKGYKCNYGWGRTLRAYNILILSNNSKLTPALKAYMKIHYDRYSVITDITRKEFIEYIKDISKGWSDIPNRAIEELIINGLYDSIMRKAKRLDPVSDIKFLTYKDTVFYSKDKTVKDTREVILHVWCHGTHKDKKTFRGFASAVEYIKSLKKGVILTGMYVDTSIINSLANLKGFEFIQARKEVVSSIRELNLSCIVDVQWLTSRDPMLSVVKTLLKWFPSGIGNYMISDIIMDIDKDISEEFNKLRTIYSKYAYNCTFKIFSIKPNVPYDQYTEYLCMKLRNYYDAYVEKVLPIIETGRCSHSIITAVAMKTKAYRISSKAYKSIKSNELLRILCKK